MEDIFQKEEKVFFPSSNANINNDLRMRANDINMLDINLGKLRSNDILMDVDGAETFVGGGINSIQRDITINKGHPCSNVKNSSEFEGQDQDQNRSEGEEYIDEYGNENEDEDEDEDEGDSTDEKLLISQDHNEYVASSKVDDYKYRPEVYTTLSLYDWTRLSVKIKTSHKVTDKTYSKFLPGHGQINSHMVKVIPSRTETFMLNFIGGPLPRCDQGDFEYYCRTMLTLFKPWRNCRDLKTYIRRGQKHMHYTNLNLLTRES